MQAARRPPGRLSRRRPPRDGLPPGSASEGAESEPWAALLRAAGVGRSPDCEPLPALPRQDPEPRPAGPAPLEVFTVGSQAFSWTPFPPAPGAPGGARRPREGRPVPDSSGAPSAQEPPPGQGPRALQSCPPCGKETDPQLDPLGMDGHIAQCVAEGTEDVA
ncbi:Fanconi anemia core complex-associated protein 20 isoform 2-T2 [Thomomys bottae]